MRIGKPFGELREGIECSGGIDFGTSYSSAVWSTLQANASRTGTVETTGVAPPVQEKWSFTAGSSFYSSPAVVDDTVYIGNDDGNIYALNADDGTEEWRYTTGLNIIESSPAVVGGTVYIGSRDSNIYALNADDGTEK